jgi:hypothetical protein
MPCEHYQTALTEAAATGVLPPEVRGHLANCADCHAAFTAEQNLFASIDMGIHAAANAELPPAFLSRLQARLAQAHLAQKRSVPQTPNWIPSWAFAAVSLAVIFFAIVFPMIKSRQPRSDSPVAQVPSADATNKAIQNPAAIPNEILGASTFTHGNHRIHSQNSASRASAHLSDLPEVIVPPAERQAFAQFVAAVQRNNMSRAAAVASAVEKENPTPLIETALVHVQALTPQMEFTDFYGNTLSAGQ